MGRHDAVHELAVTLVDGIGRRTGRQVAAERTERGVVVKGPPGVIVHLQRSDVALREDMLEWTSNVTPSDLKRYDEVVVVSADEDFFVLDRVYDGTATRDSSAVAKHTAKKTGVHGIPSMSTGQGLLWSGTGWAATDLATQAELNAATVLLRSPAARGAPEPVTDAVAALQDRVAELEARVAELEARG